MNIDALAREKFHLHSGDIIEIGTLEEHETADKMYTNRPRLFIYTLQATRR